MPNSFLMTEYFEPWLQFRQPCVRQLAFSLASPNIIISIPDGLTIHHHFDLHTSHFWEIQFIAYQQRLLQLDQHPEPLLNFLNQLKSTRLGLHFEYLLWFWLSDLDYHPYQLLGHSVQKIQRRKTLGELDFVLLNINTNEIEHWEVALKYYLGEANLSLPYWFGLNRDDTLFKKLNHFTRQQFQFERIDSNIIQKRFAVLKGQLYLPDQMTREHANLDWIHPQRRLGHWGNHLKKDYYRLTRHEWLCPNYSPSSAKAIWWTNGLYMTSDSSVEYYMFRPHLLRYK